MVLNMSFIWLVSISLQLHVPKKNGISSPHPPWPHSQHSEWFMEAADNQKIIVDLIIYKKKKTS